ncbi:MAG TPA: AmmeMemoRadiSam system protein B [Opitutaceae bacterium]|nr:AmmeMemoRadiSam system protein B [Opitutaceae bacterium]
MLSRNFLRSLGFGLVLSLAVVAAYRASAAEAAPPALKVREPAVAGLFYPKDKTELSRAIDAYLAAAKDVPLGGELKALVCPHAGYAYSGPVAAYAYRQLVGRDYSTVVVLAPSHYAALRAASVTGANVFRTPLGDVPISEKARSLAKLSPFALEPKAFVRRPEWWQQASCPAPELGDDTADTWEHSDEVQVPFLQKTLKNFQLLPVVCGDIDTAKAATALRQILDDRTLIVASSDLSHYDTYTNAQKRDRRTVEAICALEPEQIAPDDACGAIPIQILIYVAKQQGWKTRLLDYRNSGDTAGDKFHGVVGYAAIAFYAPTAATAESAARAPGATYSAEERRFLLELARKTVREVVATGQLPTVDTAALAPKFTAKKGCFVTLTERGALRGCIGHIVAQEPLIQAVVDNARNAALRDPRFSAVTADEVAQLEIEISVLTEPLPLFFSSPKDLLQKLQPGKDGVVLQIGGRGATYLPQVWEQIPDKVEFLNSLAEKAGCEASDWRGSGVSVSIYHVESFKESDAGNR